MNRWVQICIYAGLTLGLVLLLTLATCGCSQIKDSADATAVTAPAGTNRAGLMFGYPAIGPDGTITVGGCVETPVKEK